MRGFVVIDAVGGVAGEDVAARLDAGECDRAGLGVVVERAGGAVPLAVGGFVEVDVVLDAAGVAVAEVQGVRACCRSDARAVACAADGRRVGDDGGVGVGDGDVGAAGVAVVVGRGDGEGFAVFVGAVAVGAGGEAGAALAFGDGDGLCAEAVVAVAGAAVVGADGVGHVAFGGAVEADGAGDAAAFGDAVAGGVQGGDRGVVADGGGRRAVEVFGVAFVVLVADADANGFARLRRSQGVAVARCACDGFAVGVPLVVAAALRFAVLVVEPGLQGVADFVAAGDAEVAGVVVFAAVVGVGVAYLYGEIAAGGGAVAVGGGDGHYCPFFVGVIEGDAVFEFEGAAVGDFKARVADAPVNAVAVRVFGAQFANGVAALAAFDPVGERAVGVLAVAEFEFMRRVVARAVLVLHGGGSGAGRGFVVFGLVFVGCLHADFLAEVCGGECVGFRGGAVYRLAVALPLVFDLAAVHAVFVGHFGGEGLADFGLSRDGDAAFVVFGGRLWRGRRWCVADVGERLAV